MATPAQIAANRANSQKSTGATTPEGKARSCMNRLSHGFTSNIHVVRKENAEEFMDLLQDFILEYQPATPTQQVLVEKMAHNQWVSLRAIRFQSCILNHMVHLDDAQKDLPLFMRYQTTADRAFHRAHAELVKAQEKREKSKIGFESQKANEPSVASPEVPAQTPQQPATPPVTELVNSQPTAETPQKPRFATAEEKLAEKLASATTAALDLLTKEAAANYSGCQ